MKDSEDYTDELPTEIRQMTEILRMEKHKRVEALGKETARRRDEAVTGRSNSGIEDIWREDREYYHGIDEANRDTHTYLKPASSTGGLTSNDNGRRDPGSTAFFNITRQFCDAGSARMGDILLPAGDWNFSIKPTPVPDEGAQEELEVEFAEQMPEGMGPMPVIPPEMGAMPEGMGAEMPQPTMGTPEQGMMQGPMPAPPEPKKATVEDKAEKAELRIRDWLTECHYHTEVRKAVEDSAIVGTGIIQGPVPILRKTKKTETDENGVVSMIITEETVPGSFHIKPENLFPDPSCGDDVQNGNYLFIRDMISAKKLRELKRSDDYISSQIDKVLEEGPGKRNYEDGFRTDSSTKESDMFEIWYHYGLVDINDLDAMGVDKGITDESAMDMVPAVITMVNDTPIKAFVDPLDSGEFPVDIFQWQRRDDMPWGIGISRQGRTPQDQFNAAGRAMMDNAGLSSGPQLIFREGAIRPADGDWHITRRKVWIASEQADIRSVSDAITAINIPMMQVELMNIMEQARKMMEESTGIFFIMQGQQGSAPDTVGGMELLNRNASAILRRLARTFDERVTERHIKRYYEWLLEYGEDDEKGDVTIEAIGSTALVERDIQAQEAMTLLNMSLQPAFGIDPEKAVKEVLKAKRFNPDRWLMDEEKKAEMANRQPPPMPQIEVAKIRAEADAQKTQATLTAKQQSEQAKNQLALQKIQVDTDRDTVYTESLNRKEQMNAEIRMQELGLRRELALLDYANKNEMSLGKVKADLAQTAMKLNLQAKLSGVGGGEAVTPAIEPPGRAPDGQSFAK